MENILHLHYPAILPSSCNGIVENSIHVLKEDAGFDLHLDEAWLGKVRMVWGHYTATEERQIGLATDREVVELHFNLHGKSELNSNGIKATMNRNEHGLFYHHEFEPIVTIYPTQKQENNFFGASIPRTLFQEIAPEESNFLYRLSQQSGQQADFWPGYSLSITPKMKALIAELKMTPYSGQMKRLFFEAKLIELLLAQATVFDTYLEHLPAQLHPADKERLYEAKMQLDQHPEEYCSIVQLARLVGINQKKLKQGFKMLFGCTVFAYISDLKMSRAKSLLLDSKMSVGEVAEYTGYKNQQHFTVAFKKKYGMLPSALFR